MKSMMPKTVNDTYRPKEKKRRFTSTILYRLC